MTQRDAVYSAITSVFSDASIVFEDGQDASSLLTRELRSRVHSIVSEGLSSGSVAFEQTPSNIAKLSDEAKLSSYVSGLISNWLRKDRRLNGNVSYVAKNPGSRVGSGDEQLKTLRTLQRQFADVDTAKALEVQRAIDERTAFIRSQRVAEKMVDTSSLPAELIESLGLKS